MGGNHVLTFHSQSGPKLVTTECMVAPGERKGSMTMYTLEHLVVRMDSTTRWQLGWRTDWRMLSSRTRAARATSVTALMWNTFTANR
ncbi:hypothetical protein TYRP_014222 [Tyrophagus putrescentiae]|nr:hypothetical protein TYRP_014222 [Tyrophagus putrescentiae]